MLFFLQSSTKKITLLSKILARDKCYTYYNGEDYGPCIFPSISKETSYVRCTRDGWCGGAPCKTPWCAIEVEPDSTLDNWAYCGGDLRCFGGKYIAIL